MRPITSDKALRAVLLVRPEATIVVTNYERAKAFPTRLRVALYSELAGSRACGHNQTMDKKFPSPLITPLSEHGLHNITSDEHQGKNLMIN